ncbi:hypothetical protein [Lentzea tibetensis]|uniref:hypothetical protein n=1 Tax=Lentzea tibetensis TaxID=2591470 RepID=UPI001644C828|nr:hypothetical protein [Lentzea tibetensis]
MKTIQKLMAGSALILLAACSPGENKSDQVASVQTGGNTSASSSANAAPPAGEQPRRRLDMSKAEEDALFDAHQKCLEEKDPEGGVDGTPGPEGVRIHNDEAYKACASKWPLPPWEMDSSNPTFADKWHKNVQCLNEKGLKVTETEPGSWVYNGTPTMSTEEQDKITKDCEREIFGGGQK